MGKTNLSCVFLSLLLLQTRDVNANMGCTEHFEKVHLICNTQIPKKY